MAQKKSGYFKIAQLSDPHIGNTEDLVQGIDVRENFKLALKEIIKEKCDLLVLSGDLADNAEIGSYEFIAKEMSSYTLPWCFIAGNHDDLGEMDKIFGIAKDFKEGEYYYKKEIANNTILFLDSSSNRISSKQLEWFEAEAQKIEKNFMLFMHHPPCKAGHRFMDAKYALENIEEVQLSFNKIDHLKFIFCGHYHSSLEAGFGNKKVFICPSSQMIIDEFTPYFCLKSSNPAWRIIECYSGELETKVHLF